MRDTLNRSFMARQKNDGRGRLGGRAKGTPNKSTQNSRLAALIIKMQILEFGKKYLETQFYDDIMSLSPEKRIKTMSDYMKLISNAEKSVKADNMIAEIITDNYKQENFWRN